MALDSETRAVDEKFTRKKSSRTASNRKKSRKQEDSEAAQCNSEQHEVSRRELLDKALRAVEGQLNSEKSPSTATIGNLVRLIKLDRELGKDEEIPQEIRVLWEDSEEESEDDTEDDL